MPITYTEIQKPVSPGYSEITKPSAPVYSSVDGATNKLLINASNFLLINSVDKLIISTASSGGFSNIYTEVVKPT